MKYYFNIVIFSVLLSLISCGETSTGDGNGDTGNSGNTGDTGNSGNTGDTGDSGNTGDTSGGYCALECSTSADCITGSPTAITDADNSKCDNGACVYKGCNNDEECYQVYGYTGKNYKCSANESYGYKECTPECETSDDCHYYTAGSTENAYDSDNYECTGGLCKYIGCKNDNECVTLAGSEYGCREMDFVTVKINMCTKLCSSVADCVIDDSVYTEENFECTNSTCVIKQCSSDQWCKDTLTEDYTCYEF